MTTTTDALRAAGQTLAAIAEPGKDLTMFAVEFREVAATLKMLGHGIDSAVEQAEESYQQAFYAPSGRLRFEGDLAHARATALRTAQRALVDLARLVGELEMQTAADERAG